MHRSVAALLEALGSGLRRLRLHEGQRILESGNLTSMHLIPVRRSVAALLEVLGGGLRRLQLHDGQRPGQEGGRGICGAVARHCTRLEALAIEELDRQNGEDVDRGTALQQV